MGAGARGESRRDPCRAAWSLKQVGLELETVSPGMKSKSLPVEENSLVPLTFEAASIDFYHTTKSVHKDQLQ